jgi:hypothetical protein
MSRAAIAIVLFASLVACNKVDTEGFEKNVEAGLTASGITGVKVKCPEGKKAKVGVTFTCVVTIDEIAYDYDVEITKVNDGKFETSGGFRKGEPLLREKLIEILAPSIEKTIGVAPTLDCGTTQLLFSEDDKLFCTLTAAGKTGKVRVDVEGSDMKGWEIVE